MTKGKPKVKPMRPLSKAELAELALEISRGELVCSWQVPQDLLRMVFMPLAFMEEPLPPNAWQICGRDPGHGICVNGFRVLWSFRIIPKENADELLGMLRKIEQANADLKKDLQA